MTDGSQVNLKLTPGEILIGAGALVTLVFSFLHFYEAPSFSVRGFSVGGRDLSAWSSALVPIATIIVFFTVIMGLQIVLSQLLNVDLGTGIAGFTWPQIHLALGFFAVIDSFAFMIVDKGGYSVGIGLIFMLLGSVACFVGAILISNERGAARA
jgi:hypothetical protein